MSSQLSTKLMLGSSLLRSVKIIFACKIPITDLYYIIRTLRSVFQFCSMALWIRNSGPNHNIVLFDNFFYKSMTGIQCNDSNAAGGLLISMTWMEMGWSPRRRWRMSLLPWASTSSSSTSTASSSSSSLPWAQSIQKLTYGGYWEGNEQCHDLCHNLCNILTQKERLDIKLYEITPNMQVYELMGVDTEKEMDIVTRKVDRVFQVVMMMFLNGDKSWL